MQLFLSALGLALVLEGLLPFLAPFLWRRIMQHMVTQPNKAMRGFGFVSMIIGVGILYISR